MRGSPARLVEVGQPRAGVVRSLLALVRRALELLDASAQLRRACRELELALIELARALHQALVAAVGAGELGLVLREHLLAGLEL